jgi:hypothetical protein
MKSTTLLNWTICLSTFALLGIIAPVNLQADEWNTLPSRPADLGAAPSGPSSTPSDSTSVASAPSGNNGQLFASPDDAVKALRVAVEANDTTALGQIFGPLYPSLLTGDKVQDEKNRRHFAYAMEESCNLDRQSDNEIYVSVGTNNWPMPIPLKESNGQWYFDTAAGKEEVINRHFGKDELIAIGICRAYVDAQKEFASMNGGAYAQKFESSPDKKDGLYWPTAAGEAPRPFGALVASASEQGSRHKGQQPFHGYYFKILTGGSGFALMAYPEHWNQSGVMTFIVGQDGQVYQRDLGEKTARIASRIKEYNPDNNWSLVQDQGFERAAFIQ